MNYKEKYIKMKAKVYIAEMIGLAVVYAGIFVIGIIK